MRIATTALAIAFACSHAAPLRAQDPAAGTPTGAPPAAAPAPPPSAPPAAGVPAAAQTPLAHSTIGIPGHVEGLVLPGTELEPAKAEPGAPILIRIEHVQKHGSAHRYHLEFTGFVTGDFDLRTCLRRKDGTSTDDLPPVPVHVDAVRPAEKVEPSGLGSVAPPKLGGYRTMLWVAGSLWVAGLLLILFVGRGKRRAAMAQERPVTLADRLRPIVADAVAGRLPDERRAELERLLLGFWRQRLGLHDHKAADAIAALRAHDEAGRLLRALETWLHAPPHAREPVDVPALLRPYENLPADAAAPAAAGATTAPADRKRA